MKEIQLRREQEEQDRQAKLQEKREQAELAKQERQKYEIKRKENLTRMNFSDGTLQVNSGYSRMAMNTPDRIPGGNAGYNRTGLDTQDGISGGNERYVRSSVKTPTNGGNLFEVHRPAQSTPPSAFSGFTGEEKFPDGFKHYVWLYNCRLPMARPETGLKLEIAGKKVSSKEIAGKATDVLFHLALISAFWMFKNEYDWSIYSCHETLVSQALFLSYFWPCTMLCSLCKRRPIFEDLALSKPKTKSFKRTFGCSDAFL